LKNYEIVVLPMELGKKDGGMSQLKIEMAEGRKAFGPGEEVSGQVAWELETDPDGAELRLFWFTRGKGTVDTDTVQSVRFEHPKQKDRREFRLVLPEGPYSFSGKLVSLIWALELTAGGRSEQIELVMGPRQ
jgi:hypothetical protein